MQGYVFRDIEEHLIIRTKEYIDEHDPGFFGNNRHWIQEVWPFDSENDFEMRRLLEELSRRQFSMIDIKVFCAAIGFDLKTFMEEHEKTKAPKLKFAQKSQQELEEIAAEMAKRAASGD